MSTTLSRRANRGRSSLPSIFSTDPFGGLRDEFDQMLTNWFSSSDNGGHMPSYAPMVDMSESDANYEVQVDLPGIKPEDVKVQVCDNVLTISGERKSERMEGRKNGGGMPHYVERYHGTFSRSIVLPAAVKQEGLDAQYRDGVLTVTLPKAEEAKPCQIPVKT